MQYIISLVLVLFTLVGCAPSQSDLIDQTLRSTVMVFNNPPKTPSETFELEKQPGGVGTGFVIDENIIVTNHHVVAGLNKEITVLGYDDMKLYKAEVIASDIVADIAIIKLVDWDDFKQRIKPRILSWADSRNLRTGETVWSMGNPYGLGWTAAQGIISHKERLLGENNRYFLQTTTAIYPGNSGGPLLDKKGNVVGVNTAIVGREGYFGMAIPAEVAEKIVNDLREHKKVNYARLGIFLKNSDNNVQISALDMRSNAVEAGLLPEDIIHRIKTEFSNGWITVTTPDDLLYEMQLLSPGDEVDIEVERDGSKRTVTVKAIDTTEG